jgi:hypothetical protein
LLTDDAMQDASDFSLRIVVVEPDRRVVVVDDQIPTVPFPRARLPGVDLRPQRERSVTQKLPAPPSPTPVATTPVTRPGKPLPAPRHAWLASPHNPQPSRVRARSLLGVPPPPPVRAAPLSDDDERRMQRRTRAWRRIAWAQRMLERFGFAASEP